MTTNIELEKKLDKLVDDGMTELEKKLDKLIANGMTKAEFDAFQKTYESDMRGDNKINGNIGIIGEIRSLKKAFKDYPSVPWLLAHKPKQTIGGIMICFSLLQFLMTSGAVWLIDKLW